MGELIELSRERPVSRVPEAPATAVAAAMFFFDLASPFTYLAAERVDRRLPHAEWRPAWGPHYAMASAPEADPAAFARARRWAERRARDLRLPLIWPERYPARVPTAMRVADFASERGRGPAFAVAAGRLAFCGGFDLEDPRILAEAAAAAGLDVELALAAGSEQHRDRTIAMAARALWDEGGAVLPALRCDGRLLCGEQQISGVLFARQAGVAVRPSAS